MNIINLSLDKKVKLIYDLLDYLACFKETMHDYYVNNYLHDDVDLMKHEWYADEILQDMTKNEIIVIDNLSDDYFITCKC